ncbi:unnamed protein product [Paramecium sonneborni]|uniref:Uncharacterized protein n=1 Tax=Paramecium sonneborni TaxID=65129 RepID=A0A8S1LHN4_9CILI|nr:unnamed protein product [Paramecium sonneborni]
MDKNFEVDDINSIKTLKVYNNGNLIYFNKTKSIKSQIHEMWKKQSYLFLLIINERKQQMKQLLPLFIKNWRIVQNMQREREIIKIAKIFERISMRDLKQSEELQRKFIQLNQDLNIKKV